MALKCVTCGLLFRNRNELDWHVREEHLEAASAGEGSSGGARGYTRHWCSQPSPYLRRRHMAETVTITPGTRVINGRQVPEVGTWAIDPSHASFEFVARHLMAKVRGRSRRQRRGTSPRSRGVVDRDRDRRLHHRHQGCRPRRPPAVQ